jgi:hypothetical protein
MGLHFDALNIMQGFHTSESKPFLSISLYQQNVGKQTPPQLITSKQQHLLNIYHGMQCHPWPRCTPTFQAIIRKASIKCCNI